MATASQVTEWDAQGNPISQTHGPRPRAATEWDAEGNPITSKPDPAPWARNYRYTGEQPLVSARPMDSKTATDAWKGAVYGNMLDVPPGVAFQSADEIDKQLRDTGGNEFDTLVKAAETGFEETPLGMLIRGQAPEPFESHDILANFVHDTVSMITDPVVLVPTIAGSLVGAPELGFIAGSFLDSGLRQGMMDHYEKGDVKSFGELADRAGDILWAGTKAGLGAEAFGLAGELAPTLKSSLASAAMKGLYQSSAMTVAGSLLDGRLPSMNDFVRSAAVVVPLGLIGHGTESFSGKTAEQAFRDVYAKDGTNPDETAVKLEAQPPVPPDPPPGLRPAIKIGDSFVEDDEGGVHPELARRTMGKPPVSLDRLEADPELADEVLQNPAIHLQNVIDRAWELKSDALDRAETPEDQQRREAIEKFVGESYKKYARELAGQGVLDDMIDAQISPEEVSKEFWERTYFNLPEGAQVNFQKQLSSLWGGAKPGDYIGKAADGGDLVAKDWIDLAEKADIGNKAEELEGTERGYVVLMHEANRRFSRPVSKGEPRTAPKQLEGEVQPPQKIDQLYDRGQMKSGRGFVTPDGKFLERQAAKAWVKENQPEVAEMWEKISGDAQAELHADDYGKAMFRVNNRTLAEGEPAMSAVSDVNQRLIAGAREDLNKIKAGSVSTGYGKSVLRTLFVGQRDMRVAVTSQLRASLKKLIPDYRDQEALTFLRDYKDNPEALRTELESIKAGDNENLKRLIPSLERALSPSPELLEADRRMSDYFRTALAEGNQYRFLSSTIDPERYSPRLFSRAIEESEKGVVDQRGGGLAKMTTKTPHAKMRVHDYILDALNTGSVEARTLNALDSLSIYGERHARAVATNLLKMELKNTELGKQGSREEVPQGWVELAPHARTLRDFYVPKEIADAMKPILRTESIMDYPVMKNIRHAQAYVKAIELGFSVFHMKALTITAMNNMSYGDFVRSLKSDISSPEFGEMERNAAASGLTTTMTTTPFEAYKGFRPSSMPSRLDVIRGSFPIKQVDQIAQALTHETFDVIQRKFKVMDFSQKEASWLAKHPEATDAEYSAARRSIAKEVNAAYGGLNWEVMGWGKDAREVARAFILAPDWTFSNVANLKYSGEGGPGGAAARMFWIKSFATGIALTQAMSIMVSGKTSEHFDKVYLGQDKQGKKMYSSWFFAGAPKDAITWLGRVQKDGALGGTAEFLSYKLGPIASTVMGLAENKDFTGKPITKKEDTAIQKNVKETGYALEQLAPVPFGLKDIGKMLMDPDQSPSYMDMLSAVAGTSVTHEKGEARTLSTKGFHLPGVNKRRIPGMKR